MLPLNVVVDGTLIGATSPPKSFEQLNVAKAATIKSNFFMLEVVINGE
jgi:hypothetical protein